MIYRFKIQYNPTDYDIQRTMDAISLLVGRSVNLDECKKLAVTQDSYARQENDYEYSFQQITKG